MGFGLFTARGKTLFPIPPANTTACIPSQPTFTFFQKLLTFVHPALIALYINYALRRNPNKDPLMS